MDDLDLPRDALTTFLYLLMRDVVPTGRVRRLVNDACAAESPSYSAPELHALAARYAMELGAADVVDAEVAEPGDGEAGPAVVQRIRSITNGILMPEEEGGDFTSEMKAFLAMFDDRLSRLPTFVDAVNLAAEHGALADEQTARDVAHTARAMHEEGRGNGDG